MNLRGFTMRLLVPTILSALILAAAASPMFGQRNNIKSSQPALWQQISERNVPLRGRRDVVPQKYLTFRLNPTMLQSSLADLPRGVDGVSNKSIIIEIPMPDGSIQHFRMEDVPVLSPELAAQYPTWRFFQGYGVEDPTASGRFDWNGLGFHGFVENAAGTVYIDPYQKGDTQNYLVFNKHDFGKSNNEFFCRVEHSMKEIVSSDSRTLEPFGGGPPSLGYGANLRTFRLAVATTGEWSRNAAGYMAGMPAQTIRDNALGVLTTTVNRLSGIYTRELSSAFQLVNPMTSSANNIIFDDPATDPYDNTDSGAQLMINQTTLDASVGTASYDIGHLYGTGGGGVASSPSLCRNGTMGFPNAKAQGYSARGTNTGDPFTVDYVAHEIGHQFGSDHTYNNIDGPGVGACPLSSYSAANAYEPGSGSTIMSYVGICGSRNLQQYVETVFSGFHIRSLTVIDNNVRTDAPNMIPGCGTPAGTNNIPTVGAGASFQIPRLTPFTLTATGNDADTGDVANLLYSWEEYDLAPSGSGVAGMPANTYDVDSDGILRPLFRTYSPVAGNSRTFPSLPFILNPGNNDASVDVNGVRGNQPVLTYTGTHPTNFPGAVCEPTVTCVVGERLPTVNRTMNFRVAVRDRRGGVADSGTTVTVNAAAGPFQITTQNTSPPPLIAANIENIPAPQATWQAGTMQTVTWDVANTNAAPINVANVKISLSTDGGLTFPITLLASTANDGTEPILVPNNQTTAARIKVEAIGSIFFDINNANFTISAPTAAAVTVSGRVLGPRGRGLANTTVTMTSQNGTARTVRTSAMGYFVFKDVETGGTYIFTVMNRRYQFSPRIAVVTDNLSDFDLIAE
ncbi:MAG: reprolysin-like metallopeptidase [Pyrinomonadaceae bacterium]